VSAGLVPTLRAVVTALAKRKRASLSVEVLADHPSVVCWVWVLDLVAWSRAVPRGCRSVLCHAHRSSVAVGIDDMLGNVQPCVDDEDRITAHCIVVVHREVEDSRLLVHARELHYAAVEPDHGQRCREVFWEEVADDLYVGEEAPLVCAEILALSLSLLDHRVAIGGQLHRRLNIVVRPVV
jgi:hypothetical protein